MAKHKTAEEWLAEMDAAEAANNKPRLHEVQRASLTERTEARAAERRIKKGAAAQAETPKTAGHAIAKLADARTANRQAAAVDLMKQARKTGMSAEILEKIDAQLKANAQTSENWIFVMLSAKENEAVVEWLGKNSKRPHKAVLLWAMILGRLRIDTGEIMANRQELAERVGMNLNDLSKTMTELASINAIRKEKQGTKVTYFLNPQIATHLPNKAAREEARRKAGPLLQIMEGGKTD